MRTGLLFLLAISMMSANCVSRLFLKPTLPGLMRYLSSASAQAGYSGEQLVADIMEIADQGRGDAALAQAVADMRNGGGGFLAVHRDADHFGAGARQRCDLGDGAFDIGGVGVGHRLHDDRRAAADGDIADHDLRGFMPGAGTGDVVVRAVFRACSWRLEYQVLATFTKGPAAVAGVTRARAFFASVFNSLLQPWDRKQSADGAAVADRYIGQESPD